MNRNSIALLSVDLNSSEFIKSYLKHFTHQIDVYTSEKDLFRVSEIYCIFLLEESHPQVRGGDIIIQIKKENPDARFFFICELLILLNAESQVDWKHDFFSFTQFLISLDKKRVQVVPPNKKGNQNSRLRIKTINSLTKREKEIVELLLFGYTISQSSKRLNISFHTANNYVKRIYKKLGVKSRIELYSSINNNND